MGIDAMPNIDDLIREQELLWTEMHAASKRLKAFDHLRNPMGLLPDDVRTSTEYRTLKSACDAAVQRLRAFNKIHLKTIRKAQGIKP
jgi:hypothetical protein